MQTRRTGPSGVWSLWLLISEQIINKYSIAIIHYISSPFCFHVIVFWWRDWFISEMGVFVKLLVMIFWLIGLSFIGYVLREATSEGFFSHYVVEILSAYLATVCWCSLQHLLQLLDVHCLAQLFCDSADIVRIYVAWMVVIEQVKDLVYSILSKNKTTLDSLSPNLAVMPSRNS